MPFFGLSDIKIDKGTSSTRGPLSDLAGTPYETHFLKYPLDIGSADKGHFMVIYIRKQSASKIPDDPSPTQTATAAVSGLDNIASASTNVPTNFGAQLGSKINNGLDQINKSTGGVLNGISSAVGSVFGATSSGLSSLGNIFGQSRASLTGNSVATKEVLNRNVKSLESNGNLVGSIRPTLLTKDHIALYMPDTLLFTHTQHYDDLSLGTSVVGQLAAAGISIADEASKVTASSGLSSAGKAIFQQFLKNKAGGTGALAGFVATGAVVNPLLEVLYKSPEFRKFQFDFVFYPRSEREAVEVQKIINMLKYHQAPEFQEGSGVGLLIPPSEFDIKFYYAGSENKNIPQIATCVLKTIDVNYAPSGFAAYEVPEETSPKIGGTGMPVAIQMSLQFQEITYLTKNKPGAVNQPSSTDPFAYEDPTASKPGNLGLIGP